MSLMLITPRRAVRRTDAEAAIDLTRLRRWYADTEAAETEPPADADGKPAAAETVKGLDALPDEVRDYIKSLRKENEERRKRLTALEKQQQDAKAAQDAAEAERLAKQGEWQKLAEQRQAEIERLKGYEAQVTALVEATKRRNAERIARLPEAVKSLVPTGYEPQALAEWLDVNESKIVKPTAPNLNPGRQSDGNGKKTAAQTLKRLAY